LVIPSEKEMCAMKRMVAARLVRVELGIALLLLLALMSQGAAAKPTLPQEEAASAGVPAQVTAASEPLISYQGTLTDLTGVPVSATATMQFALYDAASGGAAKWGPETQDVRVTNGLFNVLLGSVTPINPTNLSGDLWLDIKVNGEQLTPRERVTNVVYALRTAGAAGGFDANKNRIDNIGVVGSGFLSSGGGGDTFSVSCNAHRGATGLDDSWVLANPAAKASTIELRNDGSTSFWVTQTAGATDWAMVFEVGGAGLSMRRPLDMGGNSITNCGALTEANLQTPEEIAAGRSDRFEEGDVLCWSAKTQRLEKCATPGDPLVQAVADTGGRPIVIGAEAVKVIGPVRTGDYLAASDVPGYAMAAPAPRFGIVIAQALEDFDGEQGIIKAMIRKM
jgi:hypothetical protein